jgi:hypothetical protein
VLLAEYIATRPGAVFILPLPQRHALVIAMGADVFAGRDGHYWPPAVQIRTCPIKASGSYRVRAVTGSGPWMRCRRGSPPPRSAAALCSARWPVADGYRARPWRTTARLGCNRAPVQLRIGRDLHVGRRLVLLWHGQEALPVQQALVQVRAGEARCVVRSAACAAGHGIIAISTQRESGCRSCQSRSCAVTRLSMLRRRVPSGVSGRRVSIISRICSNCSATSTSPWSQAW